MASTSSPLAWGRSGLLSKWRRSLRHGFAPISPLSTASPRIMENRTMMSCAVLPAKFGRRVLLAQPLTRMRWMSPRAVPVQRGRMWLRTWESYFVPGARTDVVSVRPHPDPLVDRGLDQPGVDEPVPPLVRLDVGRPVLRRLLSGEPVLRSYGRSAAGKRNPTVFTRPKNVCVSGTRGSRPSTGCAAVGFGACFSAQRVQKLGVPTQCEVQASGVADGRLWV